MVIFCLINGNGDYSATKTTASKPKKQKQNQAVLAAKKKPFVGINIPKPVCIYIRLWMCYMHMIICIYRNYKMSPLHPLFFSASDPCQVILHLGRQLPSLCWICEALRPNDLVIMS